MTDIVERLEEMKRLECFDGLDVGDIQFIGGNETYLECNDVIDTAKDEINRLRKLLISHGIKVEE